MAIRHSWRKVAIRHSWRWWLDIAEGGDQTELKLKAVISHSWRWWLDIAEGSDQTIWHSWEWNQWSDLAKGGYHNHNRHFDSFDAINLQKNKTQKSEIIQRALREYSEHSESNQTAWYCQSLNYFILLKTALFCVVSTVDLVHLSFDSFLKTYISIAQCQSIKLRYTRSKWESHKIHKDFRLHQSWGWWCLRSGPG